MFSFSKKLRKNQIDYLSKIKPILQSDINLRSTEKPKEFVEISEFIAKLDKLSKRIDDIEKRIGGKKEDGVRVSRVKKQILSLLEQHKKLSSYKLSDLINLSRTRCNEYFRELSNEGFVEGVIVGRQKYYKLVRR